MNTDQLIIVIFGATGDLTKRKLIPALYSLFTKKLLPEKLLIYCFGRRDLSNEQYLSTLDSHIDFSAPNSSESWFKFLQNIKYFKGDFTDKYSLQELKKQITTYEEKGGQCISKLFYMAVAPDILPELVKTMGECGLDIDCEEQNKWTRVIFEKPFGHDYNSALELDKLIKQFFEEQQIYRIDHYLGKETIQNILSIRFANILMKPVWNKNYIDHIQITLAEALGVEDRGASYDQIGALRDVIQNHLLQVLALVTMSEPLKYDADTIRNQKQRIFKSLKMPSKQFVDEYFIKAQYGKGLNNSKAYREEDRVASDSNTETYAALKLYLDLPEWENVPIYIRTGKKLKDRISNVHIVFKKAEANVFSNLFCELRSNTLTIRIQPNEGIFMKLLIKEPGMGMKLKDVFLDYSYSETYNKLPDAYERLILDCILGDQSLFTRSDEIEFSWKFITEIMRLSNECGKKSYSYQPGTWGPVEASEMMHKDGRHWLES